MAEKKKKSSEDAVEEKLKSDMARVFHLLPERYVDKNKVFGNPAAYLKNADELMANACKPRGTGPAGCFQALAKIKEAQSVAEKQKVANTDFYRILDEEVAKCRDLIPDKPIYATAAKAFEEFRQQNSKKITYH